MCEPLTWCALRAAAEQRTRRDRIVWRARRPHPTTCVPVGPRTGLPDAARSLADRWFCRCACLSAIGPIGRFVLDAADGLIGMRHRRCLGIGVGSSHPLTGHVSAWRAWVTLSLCLGMRRARIGTHTAAINYSQCGAMLYQVRPSHPHALCVALRIPYPMCDALGLSLICCHRYTGLLCYQLQNVAVS